MVEAFGHDLIVSRTQSGLLFLLLGLAIGSFCSVVWHRVPLGQSIVAPRSRCPHCGYQLAVRDLIPVVSYVWLRGRCRSCGTRTGWHYLAWELGAGMTAMLAGLLGSWSAGTLALAAWVSAAGVGAMIKRNRVRRETQAGFTLVEVLAALGLITAMIVPVMNSFSVARNASISGDRRTQQVAVARARLSQLTSSAFLSSAPSLAPVCNGAVGELSGQDVLGAPSLAIYTVKTDVISPGPGSCVMKVTVSCPTCRNTSGQSIPSFATQSVIRKKTNGGG